MGIARAGTVMHESNHAAGSQSDKSSPNSGAQTQQDQYRSDHRVIHAVVPMYPQLARIARIFGTVEVQITVKDGEVVSTEVKSGNPILARATVENIQTWRFYHLVNGTFTSKFTYKLEEGVDPQNPKVELELPFLVKITAAIVYIDAKMGAKLRNHRVQ